MPEVFARRPKRADARRNYDALIAAARDAFAENGADRLPGGRGPPGRRGHRHALPQLPDPAAPLRGRLRRGGPGAAAAPPRTSPSCHPWDALVAWLHRFVAYVATKRALAEQLLHDSEIFRTCRTEIYSAGEPLMRRAQAAGVVRDDIGFDDVVRLISGLTMAQFPSPEQRDRVLGVALDGLRPPPAR